MRSIYERKQNMKTNQMCCFQDMHMLLLVILCFCNLVSVAHATSDWTGPSISSIIVNPEATAFFAPGDSITISFSVTDESEIKQVSGAYYPVGASYGKTINLEYKGNNIWEGTIIIDESLRDGDYYIYIFAQDIYENTNSKTLSPAFSVDTSINVMSNADITLPDNLIIIGEEAFAHIMVKRIRLSEHVERIEKNAFANCYNLREIYIPRKCTYISPIAFYGSGLLTIYGYTGSFAEKFAETYNYSFVTLEND